MIISIGTMILIFKNEIDRKLYIDYITKKEEFEYFTGEIYNKEYSNESILISIKALNEIIFGSDGGIFIQLCYFSVFGFYSILIFFPLVLIFDRKNLLISFKEQRDDNLYNQLEIFSSIQHELGNKLPATKQEIKFLLAIFEERSASGEGLKISDKVREPLPGEELSSIDSVKDLFLRSLNKLDYSLNVVSQLGDVLKADPTKLTLEHLDLVDFLKSEVPKCFTSDHRVSIEIIGEKNLFVDIDKTQFGFLLNNLVSNAIRHGITENYPQLKIQFVVRSKGKYIHLLIMNDGCPMDSAITFEKFITPFFHFGRTGNSGLGGYIINTIVQNHNASFTLNSTVIGSDKFKTVFDFKFKESDKK
jgi:type I restriction enzyme M protein